MPRIPAMMLLCLATASCSPAAKSPDDGSPRREAAGPVTVTPLDSSLQNYYRHSSGYGDSARLVIRNRDQWDDVWSRIVSNHGPKPPAPTIDFSREVIIVAALGTRATGGYSIAVTDVSEESAGLVATVVRTNPGPTCGTTAALTAPVDIVRVNRLDVPVRFVEQQRVTDCG